jgi:hypothetical protein
MLMKRKSFQVGARVVRTPLDPAKKLKQQERREEEKEKEREKEKKEEKLRELVSLLRATSLRLDEVDKEYMDAVSLIELRTLNATAHERLFLEQEAKERCRIASTEIEDKSNDIDQELCEMHATLCTELAEVCGPLTGPALVELSKAFRLFVAPHTLRCGAFFLSLRREDDAHDLVALCANELSDVRRVFI